jgi:hypothetical protein
LDNKHIFKQDFGQHGYNAIFGIGSCSILLILKYFIINMRMGVTSKIFELNIWGIILHVLMIIKEMKIGVTRGPTYLVMI